MRRRFILLLFATACASTAGPSSQIGPFVDGLLRRIPELPALGIAVVRDGRTVYLHDAGTAYYVGSTTKAYTGLACAILAAQGRLDLDAPVSKYLPEVTLPHAPSLRVFLTHTSGLENSGVTFRTAYTGEYTSARLLAMLNDSKPLRPGFHYDNLGYIVASLVIERVTGEPWQRALRDLVFAPLGMRHTTASMSEAERWAMQKPYTIGRGGQVEPLALRKNDRTMHAAGGIVTTPSDLAIWLNANVLQKGGGIPRAAFLEAQKMQTATEIERGDFKGRGYGFGWYQGEFKGQSALFHAGGYPGWQSAFLLLPDRHAGIGIMTNLSGPTLSLILASTSFIADVLEGRASSADQRVAALEEMMTKGRNGMRAELAKRAQRPSMLRHPRAAYTGRYQNAAIGTLVIDEANDNLVATLADLRAVLEPFTEEEAARVELIPGSGEVLRFTFAGEAAKANAVAWNGELFARVP